MPIRVPIIAILTILSGSLRFGSSCDARHPTLVATWDSAYPVGARRQAPGGAAPRGVANARRGGQIPGGSRKVAGVPDLRRVLTPRYQPTDSDEDNALRTRHIVRSTRNVACRGRMADAAFPSVRRIGSPLHGGRIPLGGPIGESRNPPRGGRLP